MRVLMPQDSNVVFRVSLHLNSILILTPFLPFYDDGCGESGKGSRKGGGREPAWEK